MHCASVCFFHGYFKSLGSDCRDIANLKEMGFFFNQPLFCETLNLAWELQCPFPGSFILSEPLKLQETPPIITLHLSQYGLILIRRPCLLGLQAVLSSPDTLERSQNENVALNSS